MTVHRLVLDPIRKVVGALWPGGSSAPPEPVPDDQVHVPDRDPDRPTDDPWDANAVRYLLAQPGVADEWTRGVLMECLRRQKSRLDNDAQRVQQAAELAARHGVKQYDEAMGSRTVVRLRRTDSDAPTYPADSDQRRRLLRDA